MPWGALDDGFHEDPRVIDAGLAAAGLYACCTTYCARHLTDGFLPAKALVRMLDGGNARPVSALVNAGLLRKHGDRYEVVGYLAANPTREQVDERKAKAKAAAQARWRKDA